MRGKSVVDRNDSIKSFSTIELQWESIPVQPVISLIDHAGKSWTCDNLSHLKINADLQFEIAKFGNHEKLI